MADVYLSEQFNYFNVTGHKYDIKDGKLKASEDCDASSDSLRTNVVQDSDSPSDGYSRHYQNQLQPSNSFANERNNDYNNQLDKNVTTDCVNQIDHHGHMLAEKKKEVESFPITELESRRNIARILDAEQNMGHDVMVVAKHCNLNKIELVSLEAHAAGGGSPVLAFFETLTNKKCDRPVSNLKQCFQEYGMKKAYDIIKDKYNDDDTLDEITPLDIQKISEAVNTFTSASSKNWEDVAEYFGMQGDIPALRATIKINHSYSRTEALLRLIDTKYFDKINIGEFCKCVQKAGNNKVAIEIEKQIENIAQEMLKKK